MLSDCIRDLGFADPEGLQKAAFSQRGDCYRAAVLHPFGPAKIEVALGERGPNSARDVGPSFGPIEAEPAEMAAGRTQRRKVESEVAKEASSCRRDFSSFVAEHDVLMRSEKIGEVDAEATSKMVVANPARANLPRLPR